MFVRSWITVCAAIGLLLTHLSSSFSQLPSSSASEKADNLHAAEVDHSASVVIYGGTSAGVMAAIQAAKQGQDVILIEPGQHFGGMSVEGLGGSDIDNHGPFQNSPAVGGLALEFYRRVAKHYGNSAKFEAMLQKGAKEPGLWRFEPHVAEKIFADWLAEYPRIKLIPSTRLIEGKGVSFVHVPNMEKRIAVLKCESPNKKEIEISGQVFIDATYEGDLLHAAGVTTIIGRESNSKYNETKNGIREKTTHAQFTVRVDPYKTPGDPASGVIRTIQDEPLGTPGEGDHRLQAYCFRMCLTKNPANRIPFAKPANYDEANYEIYKRYVKAGGKLWKPGGSIPNGKTDQGSWHDLSANLYGMNYDYPGGDYTTRQRVYDEHLSFTQGLCWFLANDPSMPEDIRAAWSAWGVCKDEFQDNGGWPRAFYVRDARRMVSDYVITEHHTRKENQTPVEDPVAVAYWPPDTHHVRRIIRIGAAYNEGFVFGGNDWAPFGISYRSLVPKASECTNLITPTCPSSSHVAYGAIRLEWTFMATGQAAGSAAVEAIKNKSSVQDVKYVALRKQLLADKQVIELPAVKKESK